MNIQPTTVPAYTVTLTESEIRAAIKSPNFLAAMLAGALETQAGHPRRGPMGKNGGGISTEMPRRKKRVAITLKKARRQFRATRKAAPKRKSRKPIERVACESCGTLIASYKQGKHKCKAPAPAAKS